MSSAVMSEPTMPLSSLAANLSMRMSSLTHDWTSTKHADKVKVVQMEKGCENEAKEQVVSRTLKRKFDLDGAEEKCCSYQAENAYEFDAVGVTKVQRVQSSPSPTAPSPPPPPVQQPARKKCRHRGNSKFIRSLLCLLRKEKDAIDWSGDGKSITIVDTEKLRLVLPVYFGTKRLASFVRQLNAYGFGTTRGSNTFTRDGFNMNMSDEDILKTVTKTSQSRRCKVASVCKKQSKASQENLSSRVPGCENMSTAIFGGMQQHTTPAAVEQNDSVANFDPQVMMAAYQKLLQTTEMQNKIVRTLAREMELLKRSHEKLQVEHHKLLREQTKTDLITDFEFGNEFDFDSDSLFFDGKESSVLSFST